MLLLYILPLMFSTVVGLVLAFEITRNRATSGSRALVALLLAASLWSLGYALEIASPELNAKLFWAKFQYFGITMLPVAWFMFSIQYLGAPAWLPPVRLLRLLLAAIPAVTLILVWTNELHLLVWQAERLTAIGPIQLLALDHGLWFWVFWVYSYLLLLLGSIWLIKRALSSNHLLRWQVGLVITGACIPWIGNLLYATRLNPIQNIDWTPFGFTVAGLLFSLSYFRFKMVKVVPIAQRVVFERLNDGILILDADDRVMDLNPAAQKLIQIPYAKLLGTPLAQALPEVDEMIRDTDGNRKFSGEITLGCPPDEPCYELHVTPLTGRSADLVGLLVVLHDITQRKQEQALLEQAAAELEDRVSERTEELQHANQLLEAELVQRSLAESRFEDIVNSAPDAILLINEHGQILLANAQAELAFGYSKDEFASKEISDLIPERLQGPLQQFRPQYLANPTRRQIDPQQDLFCRRADGSEFPVEIHVSPLRTSAGLLVACTIRDISRRKRYEQEQADMLMEIKNSQSQLRALTASLEEAQEIERRQIAAELHDRVGQNLTALNLNLTSIHNKLSPESDGSIQQRLADSLELVEETTRQVRNVMAELNPPLLEEYGLFPALHWYGEKFSARTGIRVTVSGDEYHPRPPHRMEINLYRIVQEALNNVARHAMASQVSITCKASKSSLRLSLADDGVGFDPSEMNAGDEQPRWGLLTMRERAASIGGRLQIHSIPGEGTELVVEVKRK